MVSTAAERKRRSRQRNYELLQQLTDICTNFWRQESDESGWSRDWKTRTTLEMTIRAVKHRHAQERNQHGNHHESSHHREGMMLSSTLGTLLVRTNDLVVLETSLALSNLWMLAGARGITDVDHSGGLVGQSLWSIAHWDSHEEVEFLQEMFQRQDRSVVGNSFDLGLMRMTLCAKVGGLAKVVRRRIEVLHLSEDGMTALMGVPDVREEDTRALRIEEEGLNFLRQGVHVFKLSTDRNLVESVVRPRAREYGGKHLGDREMSDASSRNQHGLSIINYSMITNAIARRAPEAYQIMGLDSDGVLRQMLIVRISVAEHIGIPCYYLPVVNLRMGDLMKGKERSCPDGRVERDFAWIAWMLPGEDFVSRQFPAAADKSNFVNFLLSFFVSCEHMESSILGTCINQIAISPIGSWSFHRSLAAERAREGRPNFALGVKSRAVSQWEGKERVIGDLLHKFLQFEGRPSHVDTAEYSWELIWNNSRSLQ
jgi:hypothetical protein